VSGYNEQVCGEYKVRAFCAGSSDMAEQVRISGRLGGKEDDRGVIWKLMYRYDGDSEHAEKIHDVHVAGRIAVRRFVGRDTQNRMLTHKGRQFTKPAGLGNHLFVIRVACHDIGEVEEDQF